jgi:hypothetical protein
MTPYQQQPEQHPASAYYPAPANAPEPPKDLSVMAWLAFLMAATVTMFTLVNTTVAGRAARHAADPAGTLDWAVVVHAIGSLLTLIALVGGFVTGSMWLHRARTNAERLGPGRVWTRSSGWAWGGWVCPVVSFWFPFQVVRDTHRNVSPLGTSPVVGWWWALYLTFVVFNRIMSSVESDLGPEDASAYQAASVVFALVAASALVAWGLVLRTITTEQHDRMYGRVAPAV